jgi:predicted phage terminase large subunit-like protein
LKNYGKLPSSDALAVEWARRRLDRFVTYMDDALVPARHHQLLIDQLHKIDSGELKRLMVFWPPGHGKSKYSSEYGPAWLINRAKKKTIIHATYGTDFAERFGRKIRNIIKSTECERVFGVSLAADSRAAGEWETVEGGEYKAAGVGAGITGRRADIGLIDDPVKSRKEADSPTYRQNTWDWYLADFRTRLKPGGAIVIIQCMTGDTPVMLADATEKPLRDIRPGDEVATYKDGTLSTSTVKNWTSNGLDQVYAIKTTSGTIVRANERHPFLVLEDGTPKWIRTKNLRLGHEIVRVNGESGRAKLAALKAATSLQSAGVTAHRTTTKSDGPTASDRLLSTLIHAAQRTLSTVTASLRKSTTAFWPNKMAAVPCAGSHQATTCARTGAASCASTTATTAARFARFCATTATLWSATQGRQKSPWPQLNTCDFTLDKIVEIKADGVEEVFDVQIEGTENFIANGLVSHNTRWHEDDLSGRILPADYDGRSGWVTARDGEEWFVLNFPAICENVNDGTGRQIGEALWPGYIDLDMLQQLKRTQGSRNWDALYQQRPRPGEGGIFKEAWLRDRYGQVPAGANLIVHSWDTAQKPGELNDPSVMTAWGLGRGAPGYYLRDVYRKQVDYPTLKRQVLNFAERDKPAAILIEDKSSGQSLIQDLRNSTSLPIIPIEPLGDKTFRANEVSAMVEAGLMRLPERAPWLIDFEGEFFGFPLSTNDDQVDSVTQFLKWARTWSGQIKSVGAGMTRASVGDMVSTGGGFGSVGRGVDLQGFD